MKFMKISLLPFCCYTSIILMCFLGLSCDQPPQRPDGHHIDDPEDKDFCDTSKDVNRIVSYSEMISLSATGRASFSFTKPSWLGMTSPGTSVLVTFAGLDMMGQPIPFGVKTSSTSTLYAIGEGLDKVSVSPNLSRESFLEFSQFVTKLDPSKPITAKITIPLGDLFIVTPTPAACQPFDVITQATNGTTVVGQITTQFSLPETAEHYLISAIEQVPDSAFKNPPDQRREALKNKISAMANAFSNCNIHGAHEMLVNDIMAKTDGGNDDWITDPWHQDNLLTILSKIESILAALDQ